MADNPYMELRPFPGFGGLYQYCRLCNKWDEPSHAAGKKHRNKLLALEWLYVPSGGVGASSGDDSQWQTAVAATAVAAPAQPAALAAPAAPAVPATPAVHAEVHLKAACMIPKDFRVGDCVVVGDDSEEGIILVGNRIAAEPENAVET